MKETNYRLAMGQMLVEGGEVESNLKRACALISQAASKDCRVIVLPECLDIGWTNPIATELAQPIPGPISNRLCQAAEEANLYVVAGVTEREADRVYNSALLISPEGKILRRHRKINILDIAQDLYSTGQSLEVVDTSLGAIGIDVCADNFSTSHVLGHSLARMGARVILSPTSWAVPGDTDLGKQSPVTQEWIDSYTTLARLYDLTIVGVSNVGLVKAGPWKGYHCIGGSLAVGPGGKIITQCEHGVDAEELRIIDIQVTELNVCGTDIPGMLDKKGYKGP